MLGLVGSAGILVDGQGNFSGAQIGLEEGVNNGALPIQ
jgi:hypothetical protein